METPAHIAAQRIVGGSLALDLLNTQNGPAGGTPEDDALRDYADVVAWGAYVGLLSPEEAERLVRRSRRHPEAARAVFARVIETRGYLYELFRAIATGRNPPPAAIARLQARRGRGAGPRGARPRSTTPTSGAGPTTTWGDRCGPSSTRRCGS